VDHLRAVRDIAKDDSGSDMTTVVNHLIYDAFGRVRSESNPAVDSFFLFTARPFDQDSQLQNNLNRWYDARVGRWLSEDPIGFAAGDGNLYRYAHNEALLHTDANGLYRITWGEWGGYGWPDGFRNMVVCSLWRIASRLPSLIQEIDADLKALSDCIRCFLSKDLNALRAMLVKVLGGIRSSSEPLRFFRYEFDSSHIDAVAIQGPIFAIFGYPRAYIAFNQAVHPSWVEMPADEQDMYLFHELTHLYGSVDDDSKGELMNAHTISWLVVPGHTMRGNTIYMGMKREAARKCREPLPFE